MKFYMPVKVFDEPECVANHAKDLKAYGKKALIVTGRSSAKKCGALDDVTAALEGNGQEYSVFSEIEENPSVETIMKGASFGIDNDADFVIGIGGGSPLDAAKAIAFMMKRGTGNAADLYDSSLSADALAVIAVPTTCGTGSEVTGVSVLTRHDKNTKISIPHRIFPELALVDGKYLRSASQAMIINTSADALAHMIESYLSKKADTYSMAMVLAGLSVWKEIKGVLDGSCEADDEKRALLMRASTFAGMAIAQTGTSIPHALSYNITYDLGMPHGMACAYSLAEYLGFAHEEDQKIILETAGFGSLDEFKDFMKKIFPDVTVDKAVLQRAYDTVSSNKARMQGCRFDVDEEILKKIAGLQ